MAPPSTRLSPIVSPLAAHGAGSAVLPWRLLRLGSAQSAAGGLAVLALLVLIGRAALVDEWRDVVASLIAFLVCWLLLSTFVRLHRIAADEKAWLLSICTIALMLRVLLGVVILNGPWDRFMFGEDQWGYDYIPTVIAASWSGDTLPSSYETNPIVQARKGYFTFVALQYYVLGGVLLVPRIFNALAGALIVFYSFRLTGRIFGRLEARVAALWTAFFPSLVIWSAVNLRDIWLALSVLVVINHAFLLRDRFSLLSVATILSHLVWIQYNRSYLVMILVAACISVFLFARSTNLLRDVAVALLLIGLLVGLYQAMGLGREGFEWLDLERIAEQRDKLARADVGRSGYLQDLDIKNPAVLIVSFPLLLAYFLFSPFPWQMVVARRLVTAPEMVFWYWLVPFVVVAIRHVLREQGKRQLALLMTLAVVTLAFAVPSANVGLAYRYRAQIIPLFLSFAAAGYVRKRAPQAAAVAQAPALAGSA